MDASAVRERAADVPAAPGCYQFLADDVILYVGKAVDLRDRIRSYVDPRSRRVAKMIDRADAIDFAVTETETQALLLEANLIKRFQPRYNVRLKDDKSYPLVQLTDHPIPRVEITRDPDDSALVFGPFTSRARLEAVVKALRAEYGLRGCSDHKYQGRERPCLDYDIGICAAPCTGEIAEDAYAEAVDAAERFFEGEAGVLAEPLTTAMEHAAAEHRYERAANLRDRLDVVRSFHDDAAAAVMDASEADLVDVLGAAVRGDRATVARLHSEGGKLVDRDRHRLSVPDDATEGVASVLAAFIPQYYAERQLPDVILVPENPGDPDLEKWLAAEGVTVKVPAAGREATLVELALKNARTSDLEADGVAALGEALGIDPPARLEGFDVSHAQGAAVVGSNVAFADGEPVTDHYRRKKLDETNDDYGNMAELLGWRARRAVEGRDARPDPDLLVIDGGEAQLAAAREAIEAVGWDVPAIGIAKAEETVYDGDRSYRWSHDDPALHLVQRVRDEAHRFAVQYHQSIRDEVSTALEGVEGVGPARRRRLLRRFGSVENVRTADPDELRTVDGIGEETARRITERL